MRLSQIPPEWSEELTHLYTVLDRENSMTHELEILNTNKAVSPDGRGGVWLPVILATVGVGVVLSGIFAGSTGLYGDVGEITFSTGELVSPHWSMIRRISVTPTSHLS